MAIDINKLIRQSEFCRNLMERLDDDIVESIRDDAWCGVYNYDQKRNDIIRLRRELNKLNKMLNPWEDGK